MARHLPPISSISVVEGDAAEFQLPPGPVIAFLYNPFRGQTLQRVLQRLTAHAHTVGQTVHIVYVNPQEIEQFTRLGWKMKSPIIDRGTLLGGIWDLSP